MSAFVEEHGEIILGKYSKDHFGSFIQAIKDNRPQDALANFEDYAANISEMLCMNIIAHKLKDKKGKTFEFDAANLRITNDDEADALLRREYRAGFAV